MQGEAHGGKGQKPGAQPVGRSEAFGQPGQLQPVPDNLRDRIRREASGQHPVGLGDGAEQRANSNLTHLDPMHQRRGLAFWPVECCPVPRSFLQGDIEQIALIGSERILGRAADIEISECLLIGGGQS